MHNNIHTLVKEGLQVFSYEPDKDTPVGNYKAVIISNPSWVDVPPIDTNHIIKPELNYAIRWGNEPDRFVDIDLDCAVARKEALERFIPKFSFGRKGEGHLIQEVSDPTYFGKHVIAFGRQKKDTLIELRGNNLYSVASGRLSEPFEEAKVISIAPSKAMTYFDTKKEVFEIGLIAQLVQGYSAPMNDYLIPIVGEMCFQKFDIEYTESIIKKVHNFIGRSERWAESKKTIKGIYKKNKPSGLNTTGQFALKWQEEGDENGATKRQQVLDVMKFLSPKQVEEEKIDAENPKKEFKPLETFSLGEIMSTTYPPVKEIVKDLMTPGVFYFSAKPKIGKSFLMLQCGYSIASGITFLGKETVSGNVLMLCYEDHAPRIKSRADMMKLQHNERLKFAFMSEKMGQGFEEQIMHWVDSQTNPQLIVVDTYGRSHDATGRGSDAYEVGQQRIDRIQREMLKRNVCLVFITHDTKRSNKDKLNNMTGTNAQQGQDGNWRMDKKDRADSKAPTSFTFIGRDLPNQNFLLRMDDKFHWNFVSEDIQQSTEDTDNIIRAIGEICKTQEDAKPKEITDWLFNSIRETDGELYYDPDYVKTDTSRLKARIKAMRRDKEIVSGKRQYSVKIVDPNEFADNVIDIDFSNKDDDSPY